MKKFLFSFFFLAGLVACNEKSLTPGGGEQSGKIRFLAGGPALTANVSTKATVVTGADLDTYGFLANAVKGTVGTDTEVWTNQEFAKVGDTWEQDKWWPNSNSEPYRFYAVYPKTYTTTFAAGGPTISASNEHDIICAYAANPTYKSVNTLSFDHIFARLTDVTVSAVSPYTISDVSISITPLVSGTYNLYTGAGQTDGTGWSNTSAAASASVIASATGVNSNDIYLVPGSYTLTASWTATKDNYTQTFTGKTVDVDLVAGKTNKITASLTGDGTEIKFSVSVTAWEDNTIDAGIFPVTDPAPVIPQPLGRFTINAQGDQVGFAPGNLQCTIASGPDATGHNYTGSNWGFAQHQWDVLGYSENGPNTFTIGQRMDLFAYVGTSATYDTYGLTDSHDYDEYYGQNSDVALKTEWGDIPELVTNCGSGWRSLTHDEMNYLMNYRTASTINGVENARYCVGSINMDATRVGGLILFPDDYDGSTPAGVTWGVPEEPEYFMMNSYTFDGDYNEYGTNCTTAGWEVLAAKGCVFLPFEGYLTLEGFQDEYHFYWYTDLGEYWTSSGSTLELKKDDSEPYSSYISPGNYSISSRYCVRLVKDIE